jgi:hypothetical protein
VSHRYLLDRRSHGLSSHEDFGVHEGADRLDGDRVEYGTPEDLEGAVDVSNPEAE